MKYELIYDETTQAKVLILNKKINKKNALQKEYLTFEAKDKIILQMASISELNEIGIENILELLRHCFMNEAKVVITELRSNFIQLLPKMPCVKFYNSFEEGITYLSE